MEEETENEPDSFEDQMTLHSMIEMVKGLEREVREKYTAKDPPEFGDPKAIDYIKLINSFPLQDLTDLMKYQSFLEMLSKRGELKRNLQRVYALMGAVERLYPSEEIHDSLDSGCKEVGELIEDVDSAPLNWLEETEREVSAMETRWLEKIGNYHASRTGPASDLRDRLLSELEAVCSESAYSRIEPIVNRVLDGYRRPR